MLTAVHTTNEHEPSGGNTRPQPRFRPPVDILEKAQELIVLVDLPGVSADQLEVDFRDGELKISGRVPSRHPEGMRFLAEEYGVGDFQRSFQIGEQINAAHISAEFSDGVLTLRLPKMTAPEPRKIEVKTV